VIPLAPRSRRPSTTGRPGSRSSAVLLFTEELAAAVVKDAPLDNTSLVQRVSQTIDQMHTDGTLSDLSDKWYGTDLTQPPAGRLAR
jgi:ABC-type amino acid transport substrate-binding protein